MENFGILRFAQIDSVGQDQAGLLSAGLAGVSGQEFRDLQDVFLSGKDLEV